MSHLKIIPCLAFLGACVIQTTSATEMLKPSLIKQMQVQDVVNYQAAQTDIRISNSNRLAEIRERTLARLAANQNTTLPTPEPSPAPITPTVTIRPATTTPQIRVASVAIEVPQSASTSSSRTIANIDMSRVASAWLEWNNSLRSSLGLTPYTINSALNATAQEWSEFSRDRGYIMHGRPGDGCVGKYNFTCYNFGAIDSWFAQRGVDPISINRSKHTENL